MFRYKYAQNKRTIAYFERIKTLVQEISIAHFPIQMRWRSAWKKLYKTSLNNIMAVNIAPNINIL